MGCLAFVFVRKKNQLPAEQDQGCETGQGHEAVDGFRQKPHGAGAQDGAQHHRQALNQGQPGTEQKPGAPAAVEPPAENRAEGEAAQEPRNGHPGPVPVDGPEGRCRQSAAPVPAVGDGNPGGEDHQGRQGADDDGIQEYLQNAHKPLLGGMVRLSAGVGHGGGTHPRLVGKHPSGTAYPEGLESASQKASCDGSRGKGSCQDHVHCPGNRLPTADQGPDTEKSVGSRRQRHQCFGGSADAPGPAKDSGSHSHRQQQAHGQIPGYALLPAPGSGGGIDGGDHTVDLGKTAHPEGRSQPQKAVEPRHPLPGSGQLLAVDGSTTVTD